MYVMVDLCVIPLGVGVSVSNEIATCQRVIAATGLKFQMHPYGTVIEGEWDAVMNCVKDCHRTLHEAGVPRISTTLKLGTRTDKIQHMEDKMLSVHHKLTPR